MAQIRDRWGGREELFSGGGGGWVEEDSQGKEG